MHRHSRNEWSILESVFLLIVVALMWLWLLCLDFARSPQTN
jgi:hypothetical protein